MDSTKTDNTALYVDEKLKFGVRQEDQVPAPADGELLIENHFSGVNPADVKHATQLGIYPAVLGYDFAGKVLKAPASSQFKQGTIVAGSTPTGLGRPAKYGAHQGYLACPEDMAFSVPENLPAHHAACMSVVAMTAADALYNIFEFPLPQDASGATSPGGPLLIWGASSSVGICAVQFAHASGVHPIFVTASPARHALLQELGATRCFDYRAPDVVSDIKAALTDAQKSSSGAAVHGLDTVGSESPKDDPKANKSSAELLALCLPPDAVLASVVIQRDPRFKMPFATRSRDVTIRAPGVPHPITIPAQPAFARRAGKAFSWAVENYGAGFRMPAVEVFEGNAEQALEAVKEAADHGRGFGKLVLKHPLRS